MIESTAIVPLVFGALVLVASLISLKLGLSVAIIEIILGAISGQFGLPTQDWMTYLAGFGGILLTFLAGTEIDTDLMKKKFKASFLIGFFSFLLPFLGVAAYTYFVAHWNLRAALLAGTALSTTSLAVVYSVLVETGLSKTQYGQNADVSHLYHRYQHGSSFEYSLYQAKSIYPDIYRGFDRAYLFCDQIFAFDL